VVQSPPVHEFFQPEAVQKFLVNREYLFDGVPAIISTVEDVTTVDDLVREFPKLSLLSLGLLGNPTTPMLVIAGAKDTQVPIADAYLLLSNGDVPKDAWINPSGGHLGREASRWKDQEIFAKIIVPWEVRVLGADSPGGTRD
jgi:fermentation-respiration switch protein FrsA (DUF1100 family)